MKNPFRIFLKSKSQAEAEYMDAARRLAEKCPVPLIWLYGKTGSGKSSIIRELTGVEKIEIGTGYRPQTRFSTRYDFPSENEPLLSFLDTRGLGEVDYDPTEELKAFGEQTHLMIVVVRALDHALEELLDHLRTIRRQSPERRIILAVTSLHDAYPGQQHPEVDPFDRSPFPLPEVINENLRRSLQAQYERFQGIVSCAVPIDFTPKDEGFNQPSFGSERLKATIIEALPAAYRQTLRQLDEVVAPLRDYAWKQAMPVILGTSTLAATAAAVPVPWIDIPVVMGLQSHLAYKLARIHRQRIDAKVIAHVTGGLGGRVAIQFAIRESLKFIPWVGMAANAAAAFAYTFAGGMVWNWYFTEVRKGHVPTESELRQVFQEQLARATQLWKTSRQPLTESGN